MYRKLKPSSLTLTFKIYTALVLERGDWGTTKPYYSVSLAPTLAGLASDVNNDHLWNMVKDSYRYYKFREITYDLRRSPSTPPLKGAAAQSIIENDAGIAYPDYYPIPEYGPTIMSFSDPTAYYFNQGGVTPSNFNIPVGTAMNYQDAWIKRNCMVHVRKWKTFSHPMVSNVDVTSAYTGYQLQKHKWTSMTQDRIPIYAGSFQIREWAAMPGDMELLDAPTWRSQPAIIYDFNCYVKVSFCGAYERVWSVPEGDLPEGATGTEQ